MGTYIQTEDIDENDYLDDTDYEVIQFIKNLEKQNLNEKPEPSEYRVATHTTTCYMGNKDVLDAELYIDITAIIRHLTYKIIDENFLHPVENPKFQGIVTDHINIRFDDDMFRKKKYKPNSILIGKNVNGKITFEEYFDENDLEGTRQKLTEFLNQYTFEFIQKNGRQKREKKKQDEKDDYEKKNVITTYNIHDLAENEKKMDVVSSSIEVVDEAKVISEKASEKGGKSSAESKEYEHMYNSCSIIIKPTPEIKAVNVSLFSNSQMTISGSKMQYDGLEAAKVLLNEFKMHREVMIKGIKRLDKSAPTASARKKNKIVFPIPSDDFVDKLEIMNYNITLINANFNANFNIDLKELNQILVENEAELFVVYDPEKHRGVQINYFWNKKNQEKQIDELDDEIILLQDGVCRCPKACSAKKVRKKSFSSFEIRNVGNNYDTCTKVKICLFKSGSIGLIGGTDPQHTADAYTFVNHLLTKYYANIVKVSLDEYLKEKKSKKSDAIFEVI